MTRLRPALLLLVALSTAFAQRYVKEAGSEHFLFLKEDGSVWGFGACWSGQLGPVADNCKYVPVPQQIALPGKAIDIAASAGTSYAVLENGSVYAWGVDLYGELGSGILFVVGKRRADRSLPAPVPGLANIVQVAANGTRAAAVQSDGAVWVWGQGFSGEMREIPAVAPTRVASLPAIQSVTLSDAHVLALARDGSAYAWGSNSHGQLGDGTVQSRTEPVRVASLPPAVSVAAGMRYSVAVLADGTVRAWGANSSATMGNGDRISEWTAPGAKFVVPTVLAGVAGAKSVAANHGTVVVLMKDGTLRAWGHDGWGQAGIGTYGGYQPKPVRPKLTDVANVFLNNVTCFAVTKSGQLYVWGFGNYRLQGVMKKNLYVPTLF
jgi:alpha-tubulin suppressor-like RCC1 family protein